jgi:hypothetical protein
MRPGKKISAAPASTLPPGARGERWRGLLGDFVAGTLLGPFIRLIAAFILGAAGVFLTMVWQLAPQRLIDAAHYAKFTTAVTGQIVESWVAVEWNPADMRKESLHWQNYTKASPCAVVEYAGEWGPPARRAFCGKRFTFNDDYTLHDLREVTTGVPFAWARDASGFILPEIRLAQGRREWLATHAPASTFMLSKPSPTTALEALQRQYDRPVDQAIAGWSQPAPDFPLLLDPQHPTQALPAAVVATLRTQQLTWLNWIILALFVPIALWIWFTGMGLLLGGLPRLAATFLAILPLFALPWWGPEFPHFVRSLNKDIGGIFTEILGEFDRPGGVADFDPTQATLADGDRLLWQAGQSIYGDTFGRFHYALPQPAPESADAALAALAQTITAQMRPLGEAERSEIFSRLKRDTQNERLQAGIVFLPAAKEAVLDPRSSSALRRAATGFVSARLGAQFGAPYPRDLGYHERERLYQEVKTIQ